jgi:hypothetical protein
VLSLALAPLGALAPEGTDPDLFRWLSLVQPVFLSLLGVALGQVLAHRVDLDAPLLRALVAKRTVKPMIAHQLAPGLLGGFLAGMVLIGYTEFASGETTSALQLPLATRMLYGGVTEEIIARWGLMSLGVWLAFKLSRAERQPQATHFWFGNLFAAALFSAGHLPVLFAASSAVSPQTIVAVLAGNMVPALIFGRLFQTRGLEAAIIAHVTAHAWGGAFSLASSL